MQYCIPTNGRIRALILRTVLHKLEFHIHFLKQRRVRAHLIRSIICRFSKYGAGALPGFMCLKNYLDDKICCKILVLVLNLKYNRISGAQFFDRHESWTIWRTSHSDIVVLCVLAEVRYQRKRACVTYNSDIS